MKTVNIHQTKTQLSRLIERVNAGEEIVIAKAGRPVARLVPVGASAAPRTPGLMRTSRSPRTGRRSSSPGVIK